MIRAVLAVLLAVALLGVSFPVLDDAREERSETVVESELGEIEAAAVDLARTEEAVELDEPERAADGDEPMEAPGLRAASRRSVSVVVPDRTLTEAPVEYVAIGGIPAADRSTGSSSRNGGVSVLAYRLGDGDIQIRHTPVEFRTMNPNSTISPEGDPLVLRGDAELTLALVELDGDRVVLVRWRA